MADNVLRQESKKILKQMGTLEYSNKFYCPIMKVLQMRHPDLDESQARRVIKKLSL
jgi:predicted PP-loop superfamily ATPase